MIKGESSHTERLVVDLVMASVLKPKLDLVGCDTYHVEEMGVRCGSKQEHIDNVITTE